MLRYPSLPAAVIAVSISMAICAPEADRVTALPGWDKPLPSRVYSGFVPAGSEEGYSMVEHYIFMEAEESPETAPLIIWTNGGPGASSLFGLFVELGPLVLDDASVRTASFNATGVPTLQRNEYGWTKVANVVILNSPPPVGFSFCEPIGPTGDGNSCGSWNDTRTAVHNADFVMNWFESFPEYKKNDLFLIGESYAGVYVPMLLRELLQRSFPDNTPLNIKGMAIGDGCVGTDVLCGANQPGPIHSITFFHGHGQFSDKLYNDIFATCPRSQLVGPGPVTDAKCKALLGKMQQQLGGYYPYNLYDACWYENDLEPPKSFLEDHQRHYWGPPRMPHHNSDLVGGAVNDYPCGGPGALWTWVNRTEVRKALHVAPDANFFSGDNGVGFTYNLTEANLLPFYKHLVEETDIRVLVYNGDTDPGINSFIAQNWTSYLGFDELEEWRPWTIDGKQFMGGYVTRYKGDFDFLTIRGSGHMVPEYKPRVTLEFLSKFLANTEYLPYKQAK